MSARRVSLPVSLGAQYMPVARVSPTRLSPPAPGSPGRRSLPTTPHRARRSLPCTPRSPASPRPFSPRLPDLDETFPVSSSSSCETSPKLPRPRRAYSRYQYSMRDSGYMEHSNSVKEDEPASEREEGQIRSFLYKHGAVVDNGFQHKALQSLNKIDVRRATCPEIFLLPESGKPVRKVIMRIYGRQNTGKKTLSHQIYHHASTATEEQIHVLSTDSEEKGSRVINFLLNNEEVQLEILIESALESSPLGSNLTMFIVVYNVDSRESFINAAQLLNRIFQTRPSTHVHVLLVANKIDLKRNQIVSSIEGKSLAKIYKCSFVEISALLGMNLGEVWNEIIRQLEHPEQQSWMEKIVNRGRTFAKSCEGIVQKLITA